MVTKSLMITKSSMVTNSLMVTKSLMVNKSLMVIKFPKATDLNWFLDLDGSSVYDPNNYVGYLTG